MEEELRAECSKKGIKIRGVWEIEDNGRKGTWIIS